MADPSASDVHTDTPLTSKRPSAGAKPGPAGASGFKCSNCGAAMADWKNGSLCATCAEEAAETPAQEAAETAMGKAAAKPAAPSAGAAKPAKSGGNVQDEFPKCPSCGTPTANGTKCADCQKTQARDHKIGDATLAQTVAQSRQQQADAQEEEARRSIRGRARASMARMLGLDAAVAKAQQVAQYPPTVLKADAAKMFSYAPMYIPGRVDAHGEFVKSADDLQQAAWDYVEKTAADRTVYLQHTDRPAGKWVEITSWPYAVEAPMVMPGTGEVRKASLPAGTVYLGVKWEPWAWEMVQKGQLLGWSMGGWAKRVTGVMLDDAVAKAQGGDSAWPPGPAGEARQPFNEALAREILGLPVRA